MDLINKVTASGLLTIDLEDYFPPYEIVSFDLKDFLFRGLIIKEKDFRESLAKYNWSENLSGKIVAVFCSADAIIPNWAYMLVAIYAQPHAKDMYLSTPEGVIRNYYAEVLHGINLEQYKNERVVIKGCSDKPVPVEAYLEIAKLLRPVAKSIMYGEPCSTVPLFKRKE